VKGEVTTSELRSKSVEDLKSQWGDRKRDLFMLRCMATTSGEKVSSRKLRICRAEIARILTILRERELQMSFREPLL
jgi:ribosomal protein L29